MVAVQLCILVLGLIAVPILLFQPGRIVKLGVLDPDNIGEHLISNVKGGGRVFRLTTAKPVQKSTTAESVQESTVLYSVQALSAVEDVTGTLHEMKDIPCFDLLLFQRNTKHIF